MLFIRGGAWTRVFRPQGQGAAGSPITIGAYSTGNKPIINGGGARDEGPDGIINTADDELHGGATILLQNQSYWTIQDIEVTNQSSSEGNRQGIKVVVVDVPGSTNDVHVQGITIQGVTVRNVFGQYSFDLGKDTGGISLFIHRDGGANPALVDARFSNILIKECLITDINRGGIFVYASDNLNPNTNFDINNLPINGLVIRRNTISNCTGDGVVVRYAQAPLIASNLAINNHSGNEAQVQHGVALWCRSTKDATFQFNEVYGTQAISSDGLAFDADLGALNTTFQYNYSHDNLGGFVLLIRGSQNTTVRYNISQKDGRSNSTNRIFHFSKYPTSEPLPADAAIYNNTIYVYDTTDGMSPQQIAISNFADNRTTYTNNLFYNGRGGLVRRAEDGAKWEYNHFVSFTLAADFPNRYLRRSCGIQYQYVREPVAQ